VKVQVRYFASIREALGSGETVEAEAGTSLGALRERLIASGAERAQALARGRALRVALNQSLADESALLADGDEVAFFPPVTGG
jgi:molybdopterin synthase sulfur carrier subunit